jgi:hypothetical protein
MVPEIKVLFATQDAACNIINAAVAAQAMDLKSVDIYEAEIENLGLFESRLYGAHKVASFPFPAPRCAAKGYVAKFCLADEDDSALLNGALNTFFGTTPLSSEKLQMLQKKAKEMNYDVELLKPAQLYVRVRLPCDDGCDVVDAFLGYKFEPTRASIGRLMEAYLGVLKITKPKVSEFDMCSILAEPSPQPGVEIVKEKADAARKDRRGETPNLDEVKFFNNLLGIYDKKRNSSVTAIDENLFGVFAASKNVLPRVKSLSYASTIAKKGDVFAFKSEDEMLKDIMDNGFKDLAKGLFD